MPVSAFGFLGSIGYQELIVILIIVLLAFGAKRLPEIMRSMGQGVREFRRSSSEIMREIERDTSPSTPLRTIPAPSASNEQADESHEDRTAVSKAADTDGETPVTSESSRQYED